MRKAVLLILALIACNTVQASGYAEHEQAAIFIQELVEEHGFAPEQVKQVLAQAKRQQAILDAISRPAERVKPWYEYRQIFLTDLRLQRGLEFWREHAQVLAKAEQEYGVAAEYIVAIIGVETMYGANTGRYSVLDALTTLGFDYPPRQDFFRRQLKEFFLLTREQNLDATSLTGSYAGAMGLGQFMPGSYRAYAVDFNADGQIDIWQDAADAIGSVANYFVEHGWQAGGQVAIEVQPQNSLALELVSNSLNAQYSIEQLRQQGWQIDSQENDQQKVLLFALELEDASQYWLGLPNFQSITRYNRSQMYAMAVHQLAQQLKTAFEAQQDE